MSIINQHILTAISKINLTKKSLLKFILIFFLLFITSIGASYFAEETKGGISGALSSISRITRGFSKVMLLFFVFAWIIDLLFNAKQQKKQS